MKIFVSDTYEMMSKQAADEVIEIMQSPKQPLICTASGDSPAGLYKELVERARKKQAECEQTENFIHEHDVIEVAILGVGMNGHIGMNEPGTSADTRSHIINLDTITQQVGQKYFKIGQKLTQGITLGIATLMEARNIILLVSGKHKAEITQKIIENEISEKLPATILRQHPSLKIYLDAEAASKILS